MNWRKKIVPACFGAVGCIWLALLIAPYTGGGLPSIILGLPEAMEHPFRLQLCSASGKTVLVCLCIYACVLLYAAASWKNTRPGEEQGSARWGDPNQVARKLKDRDASSNKLISRNLRIGFQVYRHQRNLNITVIGGSGAGKTRGFVLPNIMQANCSMITLDPKGEALLATGNLLREKGYRVVVLDLIEMRRSHRYNPFRYLRNENDVQIMVTNLFSATTPKDSKSQDPFWDQAAEMLLMALVFYLWLEAPEEEQNFGMVMELLRLAAIDDEDDEGEPCVTDLLFADLEREKPDSIACRYYRNYRSGSGKTLKSIQLVLAAHMAKFNLSDVIALTEQDELDLRTLGEQKTALFCRISDVDPSFNFLVSMLYQQLFQQLFADADLKYHGKLPVHVQFLMDEFANISLPADFEKRVATMRSRNISVSIILQNISQLKALFEKQWESILGNCDTLLYLGGNEQSTHEYVSRQLGKETIWTKSHGLTRGSHGSSSQNEQTSGRELMTPSEVRELPGEECIVFVRGFRPVRDKKYNLNRHPNIKRTTFGGEKPYSHNRQQTAGVSDPAEPEAEYTILTEAELDALLKNN